MLTRILFVCLGNICRSPAAEAIFRKMVSDKDIAEDFIIDSESFFTELDIPPFVDFSIAPP